MLFFVLPITIVVISIVAMSQLRRMRSLIRKNGGRKGSGRYTCQRAASLPASAIRPGLSPVFPAWHCRNPMSVSESSRVTGRARRS